jgi:predicted enzyme related to lactoylglutathione lyase
MYYNVGATADGLETGATAASRILEGHRVLNFNSVLIGSMRPDALAAFYEKVFARPADFAEGGYSGWQVGSAFLTLGPHSELSGLAKEPARVLINFETEQVKEEFERIRGVGGAVVKEPYQMEGMPGWIATLADPDGNYFQLMSPMGPA